MQTLSARKGKRMKRLLAAVLALAVATAQAETETVNGYTWTYYRINDDTAVIQGTYSSCAISPAPTGGVTIPSTLGGKPVTSIGNWAFVGCSGLTRVTIPDSVTSIGGYAFSDCSGLTSVTILNSVTNIGGSAFSGCTNLTSVMIPDSVTSIGEDAFVGCSGLTSVMIGDGVTSIGNRAFGGCSGLTSVMIGDGVASIGYWAFENCTNLTSVTIPAGVTGIGWYAFSGCSGLTRVIIGDGVTSIGGYAFSGCSGLTNVTIGNGVTNIGDRAFYNSSGLTSVTIPDGVKRIEGGAFFGCTNLASVTIPHSVTNIGYEAFRWTRLATVHVASGDVDHVKNLLMSSGYDVSHVTFVEDVSSNPVAPDPVNPAPVSPGYEVLNMGDIVAPYEAPKAVTLQGAVYDGSNVVGIVELKLGKVNEKKGTGKVSGSVMTLDGKKRMLQAFDVIGVNGTTPKTVSFKVKDFGTMSVTIGGTQFAGSMGKYHVQSAAVGGNWSTSGAKAYVATTAESIPAGALAELLPDGEPVVAWNGKWKFAKAASVKWAKPKQGAALPERYDAESGKGLVVDTSGDKTNLSAMKLTYTPKKGTFKGSFKMYALEGSGKATKLKKYTIKVSGVVVGGVGHGTATCKKPAASWSVTVR